MPVDNRCYEENKVKIMRQSMRGRGWEAGGSQQGVERTIWDSGGQKRPL